MKFFKTLIFLVCLILIKFSNGEKKVCRFLNSDNKNLKIVECNSKNHSYGNRCNDPPDSILEETFARFEFQLLR